MQVTQYTNPYSTTPVTGITTTLKSSGGTTLATFSLSTLSNLAANAMAEASITPLNQVVGNAGVMAQVSIKTASPIFSTSEIRVYFPRWNPSAGLLAFHYI